jgi:hypothetical protein
MLRDVREGGSGEDGDDDSDGDHRWVSLLRETHPETPKAFGGAIPMIGSCSSTVSWCIPHIGGFVGSERWYGPLAAEAHAHRHIR